MTDSNSLTEQVEHTTKAVIIDLSSCESMKALQIHNRSMSMPLVPGADLDTLARTALEQHEQWHQGVDIASITEQLGHAPTCNPVVSVQSTP